MKPPSMVVVNGAEAARVMGKLQEFLQKEGISATMGASGCLMLFAVMLRASGHPEQEGHNALDRIFHTLRILDGGKPS